MRKRGGRGAVLKKIIITMILLAAVPLVAEKIYSVLSRGLVLDRSTGLYWTRCALSTDNVPIYDFNCKGEKKIFTIDEAINACSSLVYEGRSDWRLPNVRELQSIVYYYHKPTLTTDFSQAVERVFPNAVTLEDLENDKDPFWGVYCFGDTCRQHYWSSTEFRGKTDPEVKLYWIVNFYNGVVQWDIDYYKDWGGTVHADQPKRKSVRCVAGP